MSPVRDRSRLSVALLAGTLLVSLLPATALAASPAAVDQTPSTNEDADLLIVLTGTDADGDALTFAIETGPANGSLSSLSSADCITTPLTCTVEVTYTPDPDSSGPDSVTFSVDDGSLGTANGTVDITVDPVNDPPSGTDKTVDASEDTAFVFAASDFGFSDTVESDDFAAVKVTSLPTVGFLTNNSTGVNVGDDISVSALGNGDLAYLPAEDAHGNAYASFGFRVQDDGGIANGGEDSDPVANTMTIDVSPVNDAPSGADETVSTPEDTPYVFAAADFGFTDASDTPPNALESVHVTTLPAAGVLRNNGALVVAGGDVTAGAINAGHLAFTPDLNEEGSPYTTFTFQVEDDGGGTDLDPTANTMTIDVAPPSNDPPSGADKAVTILEDGTHIFVAADFGFSDPDDNPSDELESVKISSLPGAGSLTNGGVGVVSGTDVPVEDIDAGDLVFTPAPNANGSTNASFTFQVRDDGSGSDLDPTPNTITVDVTSVNDAPSGVDKTVSIVEDAPYLFVTGDFGLIDPNDSPANALFEVKIVTLPLAGSLTNDGTPYVAGNSISAADIALGKLVFTPVTGANGDAYATFTFQVRDDGGTADGGVDLDQSANTITIDVGPVNSAPSGTNKTIGIFEDVPYTLLAADLGFSDPNDSPADVLHAVKITTLPGAGTLLNSGATFVAGTVIPVADITGNQLTFTPAANASGSPHTTFTFQVQDDGGTVSGGVDLDQSAKTFTVNVTARNDAPTGTNKTVTTTEEIAYTLVQADFGFSDTSDSPADTLTAVRITTLPLVGPLRNDGLAVVAGSSIQVADIIANKLVFTPVLNGNGSPYASFTFQVQDSGGTADGGTDLDQSARTITVNVTPVQDPPDARTDASFTVPESAGPTALAVLANDVEVDGQTMTITAVTQPSHGVVAITGSGTGLTYDPTQLYFGTDSFTYTISDGNGGSDTATVLLTVVKDTTAPSVVGPAEKFYAQTVASTTSRANIYWSGSDAGTGIKKYELAVSVNGGSFINLTLGSATATSLNITLTNEKSYKFRVRGTDNQGNVSAWVNGPTFKPGRIQNNSTSVVYAGPWATVSTASALGGSHRFASSLSARASVTWTTRDFALVMTKTSTSGMAEVRIDGVLAATINLHSTSTVYRQLVYSRQFSTLGRHTIEVRPIGGTRIYLDAFLLMR